MWVLMVLDFSEERREALLHRSKIRKIALPALAFL